MPSRILGRKACDGFGGWTGIEAAAAEPAPADRLEEAMTASCLPVVIGGWARHLYLLAEFG